MVDTTNNTANNPADDAAESPQRILERRLAELNSRKNDDQPRPEAESPGQVAGGAVAAHEVMPPTAAVPVDGNQTPVSQTTPAAKSAENAAPEEQTITSDPVSIPAENDNPNDGTGEVPPMPAAFGSISLNPIAETPTIAPIPATATPEASTTDQPAGEPVMRNSALPETPSAQPTDNSEAATLSTAGVISSQSPAEELFVPSEVNPEAAKPAPETSPVDPTQNHNTRVEHDMLLEEEHHDEILETDYSNLSTAELRLKLLQMLKTANRQEGRQVTELYRHYEAKIAGEKAEALHRFQAEGGSADDFEYQPGQEHHELEKAYGQFRENRSREQRQDEEQKNRNAKRKQELLDELRELVESPETKSSGDRIRHIQTEWKAIGPVPAADSKQLWNSYHALLDIFYNNRSIFYELKELDRRKNLQHKTQLCERAEALVNQPSINLALQELRKLHEEWKNVGPVPNDQREIIWERFIQASEQVHARKKEFITERKAHEQENLEKKVALLDRMEAFQGFNTDRINDWRDKTDEIQKLKEEWDAVGLVPKERADEINKRFWSSYKAFFNHKNAFFKNLDEQKMQNLRLKTELCEQAEGLRDSTDWDDTKEKLIQLQKKWKTIGRVPDKYSDKLWQRFRTACNEFFDRKQNQVHQREAEMNQASQIKQTYYEELASRITSLTTEPGSYEEYETLRNRWLGLPAAKGAGRLDDRYFDLLEKFVGSIVDLSAEQKEAVVAELQVTRYKQGPDAASRMQHKEQAIRRDIAQLENDIRTLKTNIEFFGRSKNAEKLREEYQARIAEADNRIQALQRQLYAFRNS